MWSQKRCGFLDHPVYCKLIKFVGIFHKLAHKLPDDCLKMIYFSFVHPHLLYGIEVYGNTYKSHTDKLAKLNNKLLRVLQHKNRYCKNTELYLNYNTLPVAELHQFQILCIVHKFVHHRDLLPKIYHSYFAENFKIHQYNTRNKNNLHVNSVHSSLGCRAVNYKGCTLWNSLPDHIKCLPNTRTFKNKLREYFHVHLV